MILVDSSAWIDYDNAAEAWADRTLTGLITDRAAIAVTEPVVMEVVAGARTAARADELVRLLMTYSLLPFDTLRDFDDASWIYRQCLTVGVTPRGLVDCMIMAVARRHDVQVLSADRNFGRIGTVIGVEVLRPSKGASETWDPT